MGIVLQGGSDGYMIRCPIVLQRLSWDKQTAEVLYRGRPARRSGTERGRARWDVLEFLARVVDHIPEPSQQTVRYWGFYANAALGYRPPAPEARNWPPAASREDKQPAIH